LEVVASLSQGRTAAAQCGLFTYKSVPVIFEPPCITLCRWPSGMQFRDLHTRRPPTQSDIYQMMYWYNWFSWRRALGCSKHVEKWNEHIKKCFKFVINMNCTEMHGQQNITFYRMLFDNPSSDRANYWRDREELNLENKKSKPNLGLH